MAVLLKEASPADEAPASSLKSGPLAPPFDVVTYAGPITMEGYEQLSSLLEERRTNDEVLVVLETPGGDPHAAFRIARALGFHYDRVEALISRYCKSAGTLVVLGASVLHMDDRGELGPLDMQVRRVNEIARQGSALEVSDTMGMLWAHQLLSFADLMREMTEYGMSSDVAAMAAAGLVGDAFHPIAQQIDPVMLTAMSRATGIAVAYGERLALKGRNITMSGVSDLVHGYPSHAFVIDRKEAQLLFRDVRSPCGAVAQVAQWCRQQLDVWSQAGAPLVNIHSFPFIHTEKLHAPDSSSHPNSGTA